MRVLHLVKTSMGATWALRQMQELVKLGMDVNVVMPLDGALVERYQANGITVHDGQYGLPMHAPHSWPALFAEFRQLVDRIQPALIHSHFVGTTLTMRLALGKNHPTPRVFQVPGPLHLEHSLFRNCELYTAGTADSWIGSCEWTCDRYRKSGVAEERIHLSYYGTDLDTFHTQTPGTLRRTLGLTSMIPIVGMMAYMYAPKRYLGQKRGIKGHEDLIDAVALLRRQLPDVQVVFVGGPWANATSYEQSVHTYAKKRLGDSAHFLGTRNDVPSLYADFDVVVHPSHSENVGGSAESLLLGVPTIATNVGGFPDLVTPGETGWLTPPKNPPALAKVIGEALENPQRAKRFAQEGQKRATHLFDVRRTSVEIANIYSQILERHRDL